MLTRSATLVCPRSLRLRQLRFSLGLSCRATACRAMATLVGAPPTRTAATTAQPPETTQDTTEAALNNDEPEPLFSHWGVQLVENPKLGRSATATTAFKSGSIIFSEQPLLATSERQGPWMAAECKRVLQSVERIAEFENGDLDLERTALRKYISQALAFVYADSEQQQELLAALYSPHLEEYASEPFADYVRLVACACARHYSHVTANEITCALMAFRCNAHYHQKTGGSGLFKWASKLPHTCGTPNTKPLALGDQMATVAQQGINQGELLTTTYLWHLPRLMSTRQRRKHLRSSFLFNCQCSTCTQQPDHHRGLPCPVCRDKEGGSGETRPEAAASTLAGKADAVVSAAGYAPDSRGPHSRSSTHAQGVMYHDPAKEASGHKPWCCTRCGAQASEADLPSGMLAMEEEVEDKLRRQLRCRDLTYDPDLHEQAVAWLGSAHWTCLVMTLLRAGQCASLLKLELSKVPPKYDAAVAVAGDLAACVESSWGWVESVAAAGADANADGWSFRSDAVAQHILLVAGQLQDVATREMLREVDAWGTQALQHRQQCLLNLIDLISGIATHSASVYAHQRQWPVPVPELAQSQLLVMWAENASARIATGSMVEHTQMHDVTA